MANEKTAVLDFNVIESIGDVNSMIEKSLKKNQKKETVSEDESLKRLGRNYDSDYKSGE